MICGIIKVEVSVISLAFGLLTSTLIIPHITKTSSNNCLLENIVDKLILKVLFKGELPYLMLKIRQMRRQMINGDPKKQTKNPKEKVSTIFFRI